MFESGALREDGSIVGNDNDDDASRFEPHHRVIRAPDEVQIYESILGDENRSAVAAAKIASATTSWAAAPTSR